MRVKIKVQLPIPEQAPALAAGATQPKDPERTKFWHTLRTVATQRNVRISTPLEPDDLLEERVRREFGERLKKLITARLEEVPVSRLSRFGRRRAQGGPGKPELYIRVTNIHYGSMILDLFVFGLGQAVAHAGPLFPLAIELFEQYTPRALEEVLTGVPGVALGLGAVATDIGDAEPAAPPEGEERRLWNAMNTSLLVPVLLVILVAGGAAVGMMEVVGAVSAERAKSLELMGAIAQEQTRGVAAERARLTEEAGKLLKALGDNQRDLMRVVMDDRREFTVKAMDMAARVHDQALVAGDAEVKKRKAAEDARTAAVTQAPTLSGSSAPNPADGAGRGVVRKP